MMRTRLIHPEAPKDEAVASCSVYARLAWVYLPCHADREGRLEDKPFTLRLDIFPTDPQVDMAALLDELAAKELIHRYQVAGRRYIQIRTFQKHQNPHRNEACSKIPAPPADDATGRTSSLSPPDTSAVQGDTPPPLPEHSGDLDQDPVTDPVTDRDPVSTDARAIPVPPAPAPAVQVRYTAAGGSSGRLAPRVSAQGILDTFGRVRREVFPDTLEWHAAGRGLWDKASQLAVAIESKPEVQADLEPTMRRHLQQKKGSQDPRDNDVSWVFGGWVSGFTRLREELRDLHRPAALGNTPCDFHAGGRNTGKRAPKHQYRSACPECRHLEARAGPRPASRPESAAELLGGTNAGG